MPTRSYVTKQNIDKSSLCKKSGSLLSWLDMELTERCNNNCIHCYINLPADDLTAKKKELTTDEIKNILKKAVSLGCLTVRFTGGEPLLREDFGELYIFARRQGFKVVIFTNATLINKDLAELLSNIPPLEKIVITLYGMEKNSYEAVTRTAGSYEAAWRGINLLLEKKVPFVVKGALLPPNKDEIDKFEAWAVTTPWTDEPPPYSMFFDLRCRRDGQKNELIKKLRVSPDEGLKVLTRTRRKDKYIKEMKEFCSKFMRPSGDKLFSCGAGCARGCVDAYGNFQLCMLLRHPQTLYDLRNGSLKDALDIFFPKIREIKAINPDYLNRCAKCFLKGLCEQCPAKSWMEYGVLDRPLEYLCDIAHTQARFLGLLNDGEMGWQVTDWRERVSKFAIEGGYSYGNKN